MSSAILNAAARVTPPAQGGNDLVVLASGTSAAILRVPDSWKTGWVQIRPRGVDTYYRLVGVPAGNSAPTPGASASAVTTLSSGVISSHAAGVSEHVADGEAEPLDLSLLDRDKDWYIDHIESATGGFLRIRRTSGPSDS